MNESALLAFPEILRGMRGKKVVFFLDYDGTLSPIVNNPDEAYMGEEMRKALKDLADVFPCALVSGRDRIKLKNFVKLEGLYYAGSHGMDISGPTDLDKTMFEIGSMDDVTNAVKHFKSNLKPIPGAWTENNRFTFSVHYRMVNESKVADVETIVDDFIKTDLGGKFKKSHGKKVFELKPKVNWNKGEALLYILELLQMDKDPNVVPVYIGDDVTDEDAFRVLRSKPSSVTVLVTEEERNDTFAQYRLRDTFEVQRFLEQFVADANNLTGSD